MSFPIEIAYLFATAMFIFSLHWMNDPNCLLCHTGVYHRFFQHSPGFNRGAPNPWGHAAGAVVAGGGGARRQRV